MEFLEKLIQRVSWLSLDVVIGAMAGMLFFSKILHIRLSWQIFGLLGLAVWAIYTADHLLDARNKNIPLSPRHQFHQKFQKSMLTVLGIVILIGGLGAWYFLGFGKELAYSGILGILILLSRWLIHQAGKTLSWLKELSIAVYYVLGLVLIPLTRSNPLDLQWEFYLFFAGYVVLAFLNLLMLSYLDRNQDALAGFTSAALAISPVRMLGMIRKIAFGLIFLSLAGFILLDSFYRPFSCMLLLMALIHFINFFNAKIDSNQVRMRLEISFWVPLLLIFL
jgi:hypothetical protein